MHNISFSKLAHFLGLYKAFRNSGFTVKQEHRNYWIDINESENILLTQLFHFNEEEVWLISKAIRQLDALLPVASRLCRKLAKILDSDITRSTIVPKRADFRQVYLGEVALAGLESRQACTRLGQVVINYPFRIYILNPMNFEILNHCQYQVLVEIRYAMKIYQIYQSV